MTKEEKAERLKEAKDELAEVKAAISGIISGSQSYKIGSRSVQKADLAALYKRRSTLEDEIRSLDGGTGRFRKVIPMDR